MFQIIRTELRNFKIVKNIYFLILLRFVIIAKIKFITYKTITMATGIFYVIYLYTLYKQTFRIKIEKRRLTIHFTE